MAGLDATLLLERTGRGGRKLQAHARRKVLDLSFAGDA
jgi:hypothetical protein